MKKLIVILGVIILGLGSCVRADITNTGNSFYYIFHLYYDNGRLNADRDFQFKYDVIPGDFVAEQINTQFPYHGEVINFSGETSGRFEFDPKQGDPKFTKGKISVSAPYFADAQKVVFFDSQNQPLLTIPTSESSFCNDDGICNADRGENYSNCSKDCKNNLPAPVSTPLNTSETGSSSSIWFSLLYIIGGILLVGFAWWFFKRGRGSSGSSLPPSLPTPASPPNGSNNV